MQKIAVKHCGVLCLASDVLKARDKYSKSLTVDRMEVKENPSDFFQ